MSPDTSRETPPLPPHLRPFVLPHDPVEPERVGDLDLYLPATAPAPAVLMVHGGPVAPDREVRPPQWPAYQGYAALLAQAGLVGGMFEHGFVDDESLGAARDDVQRALEALRAHARVDGDRVGLWFFSNGGLLMGSFLDPVPAGVVAVAGTYTAPADPTSRARTSDRRSTPLPSRACRSCWSALSATSSGSSPRPMSSSSDAAEPVARST